jgi:hypothetical protein
MEKTVIISVSPQDYPRLGNRQPSTTALSDPREDQKNGAAEPS